MALTLAFNVQILEAKSGSKIIFIPENDMKKHGINVPDNTQFLWLVVTGAPDKHLVYHKKMEKVAEWPYKVKLEGSSLHATAI